MKRILFFTTFSVALLLGVVIWGILHNRSVTTPETSKSKTFFENSRETATQPLLILQKEFSFENVSFIYDDNLFSDVKGEIIAAVPLADLTDKGDYVYPKHLNLTFSGSYPEKFAGNRFQEPPFIKVCRVGDFVQAYSISKDIERMTRTSFNKLKTILQNRTKFSPSGGKELFFMPPWDVAQAFHSRAEVVNFKNGRGLLFMTQLQQEQTVINNEKLVYFFQGLTNDGQHFVLMKFPVSASFLPNTVYADYPEKYKQLNDYSALMMKYQHLYEKYATETAIKINQAPSEKFIPNLDKIESVIRSLEIK